MDDYLDTMMKINNEMVDSQEKEKKEAEKKAWWSSNGVGVAQTILSGIAVVISIVALAVSIIALNG